MLLYLNNYFASLPVIDYINGYRDVDKFIVFCKQCNKYDNCWACPPYNFNTFEYLTRYETANIIGTKIRIPTEIRIDCNSNEESRKTGAAIIRKARMVLDEQLLSTEHQITGCKAFFAGTCHICEPDECTRITNEPCRYPDRIRHSLESLGFDIGKTTEELLGLELKWSSDGSLTEYLILVSGIFTNISISNIENYFIEKRHLSL